MDTGSAAPDTLKKLYTKPSQNNYHVLENVSLDDLGKGLNEVLRIQDDQKSPSKSILCQPSDPNVEMEDECEDPDETVSTIVTPDKCSSKCAPFPCSGKKASPAVSTVGKDNTTDAVSKQNGCESVKSSYPRSLSFPTPLKLVSAMKGSREKQGALPPKKLTVTWAPDVYDPPPSASTFVRIKKSRPKYESKKKYDKKNGKSKQKGKPSRASSSSKDKKQVLKYGQSSNKYYQSLNNYYRVVDRDEPRGELRDFDVGCSDSYCGSSFLKKSITKLHFTIAEAT